MSKLTKFFKHPVMFFEDAYKNKNLSKGKDKVFVVGFSTWKTYLRKYFDGYELVFIPKNINKSEFEKKFGPAMLKLRETCQVFIWGFKCPSFIIDFIDENNIKIKYVEDGFVRSVKLGATKAPPMSLCLDSRSPYFDATRPTELEDLINNYDFTGQDELLEKSKKLMEMLVSTGTSKYNNSDSISIEKVYGEKKEKRILVLGQVEDDASIKYGCNSEVTNNDIVRLARRENPEAHIIYKPHPDVLNGHRPYQSDPDEVAHICQVLREDIPLSDSFKTIDHVYAITSLAGFEALIRGIEVTTVGCPFYSGWGLTNDKQENPRRTRKLTVTELFALSYLVYPAYFDPDTGETKDLEYCINAIQQEKAKAARAKQLQYQSKAPGLSEKISFFLKKIAENSRSKIIEIDFEKSVYTLYLKSEAGVGVLNLDGELLRGLSNKFYFGFELSENQVQELYDIFERGESSSIPFIVELFKVSGVVVKDVRRAEQALLSKCKQSHFAKFQIAELINDYPSQDALAVKRYKESIAESSFFRKDAFVKVVEKTFFEADHFRYCNNVISSLNESELLSFKSEEVLFLSSYAYFHDSVPHALRLLQVALDKNTSVIASTRYLSIAHMVHCTGFNISYPGLHDDLDAFNKFHGVVCDLDFVEQKRILEMLYKKRYGLAIAARESLLISRSLAKDFKEEV